MILSPYRRGAEDGLSFGVYLAVMFFLPILAPGVPVLSMLSVLMMAGVPVLTYIYLSRYHRSLGVASQFSALWMQGLVIFFCGMLLCGAALTVYMRWINPGFIASQLQALADLKGAVPDSGLDDAADLASRMLERNIVPQAIQVVVEMLMLAIVTGSLLSMLIAAVLTFFRRPASKSFNH